MKRLRIFIMVMAGFLATATAAKAEQIRALLTGYEESPSVSTTGRGEFSAVISDDGLAFAIEKHLVGCRGQSPSPTSMSPS